MMQHQYVHIKFPNGMVYFIRIDGSGIELDEHEALVDPKAAGELLGMKAWMLGQLPIAGNC